MIDPRPALSDKNVTLNLTKMSLSTNGQDGHDHNNNRVNVSKVTRCRKGDTEMHEMCGENETKGLCANGTEGRRWG